MPTSTAPPAGHRRFDNLQRGLLAADRVEGVIDAEAFGHLPHGIQTVLRRGIDHVRRAETLRKLALVVAQIAGDGSAWPRRAARLARH